MEESAAEFSIYLEGGVGDGRVSCGEVFDGLAKNLVGPGTLLDLTDQRADTADVCLVISIIHNREGCMTWGW